jgi:hypothetical protein
MKRKLFQRSTAIRSSYGEGPRAEPNDGRESLAFRDHNEPMFFEPIEILI